MLVVAAAIAFDRLANAFWRRHLLLTSLVSSVIVVVAVPLRSLSRKRRQGADWTSPASPDTSALESKA
jgi:hypothetical protein